MASSLSHPQHVILDSDAVWQSRLKRAEFRFRKRLETVPACPVLSHAQLASLPPLPSLSQVAALCVSANCDNRATSWMTPTNCAITAIVHLPSTLYWHARVVRARTESWEHYVEFTLRYSEEDKEWTVASEGSKHSSWRAFNIDDNVGQRQDDSVEQDEKSEDRTSQLMTAADSSTDSSCKQRYIMLLGCSEHEHNRSYRLLPEADRVSREHCIDFFGPRVRPLPLCTSCRTAITACIAPEQGQDLPPGSRGHKDLGIFTVRGVVQVSRTVYEAYYSTDGRFCRCSRTSSGFRGEEGGLEEAQAWSGPRRATASLQEGGLLP